MISEAKVGVEKEEEKEEGAGLKQLDVTPDALTSTEGVAGDGCTGVEGDGGGDERGGDGGETRKDDGC